MKIKRLFHSIALLFLRSGKKALQDTSVSDNVNAKDAGVGAEVNVSVRAQVIKVR